MTSLYDWPDDKTQTWYDKHVPMIFGTLAVVGFILFVLMCFNVSSQQRTTMVFTGASVTVCNDPLWPPFVPGDYKCVNKPIEVRRK